jgi:hypothetical protein
MQKNIWRISSSSDSSSSSSSEDIARTNKISNKNHSNGTRGITLECDYAIMRHYWGEMYTCVARNLVSMRQQDFIKNVTGYHLTGKTVNDVQCIYVLGQRTPFLPYNITTPFGGSVKALRVEGSGLRYVNKTFAYYGKKNFKQILT